LNGINYVSPIASAQVKSCILLAGLNANGVTTVSEPYLSRNHSELLLKYMGADVNVDGLSVSVKKSSLIAKDIHICGDISSAAYFIVAALIVPGSDIILRNVGLNPTRCGILEVAKAMGGDIKILDKKEISGELVGDIRVRYSELKSCNISGELIPRLIDELPVIAVLATQADGETTVSDASDLRNKESDRISTIVCELKKLGANIEEKDDGFVIVGKTALHGGCEVETYNDHRLAMSLFVAGLVSRKEIGINGFEWAGISFPEFEELFLSLLC
jgi:3-phosphoshikimate 1-carboxyvinyltransferase